MLQHSEILRPVVILIGWSLVMLIWTLSMRLPAMSAKGIRMRKLTGGRGADADADGILPDSAQWKAHNYNHLMEQPTLFYAVGLTLAVIGAGSGLTVILAWGYVVLRIAHSIVQATFNRVVVRFTLFVLATLCLAALTALAAVAVFHG